MLAATSSCTASLARFWELAGRHVFESDGIVWGHYKGPFYTSLPFHRCVEPDPAQIDTAMRRARVVGLRFPSRSLRGISTGMYVANPANYNLQSVHRKQRSHVTRGLEVCEVRPVETDELLTQGLELNQDTLRRQARDNDEFLDPVKWKRLVHAVSDCPGAIVRGAFIDGRLSAYIIGCRDGEWLHLLYKASRTADLGHYPNHALDYSALREAASDPSIAWVGNGNTSLVENEGLDRYKRYMGYAVDEHNLCIRFHPALSPFLSRRLSVVVSRYVCRKFPNNERVTYYSRVIEGSRMSRETLVERSQPAIDSCQQETAPGFSRLVRPGTLFPILRVIQTFKEGGPRHTAQMAVDYVKRRTRPKKAIVQRPLSGEEVLNLQPGEWVEVKSAEEIAATLDARGKNRGLLFTEDMKPYVGKRFQVFKRVETIFLEESKQRRTLKNTVLLTSVYCPGTTFNCDRSCFLFWKEVWLKRA